MLPAESLGSIAGELWNKLVFLWAQWKIYSALQGLHTSGREDAPQRARAQKTRKQSQWEHLKFICFYIAYVQQFKLIFEIQCLIALLTLVHRTFHSLGTFPDISSG